MRWIVAGMMGLASTGAFACDNPKFPTPDVSPERFVALFIVPLRMDDVFPLCGALKQMDDPGKVMGKSYRFDEVGNLVEIVTTGVLPSRELFLYDDQGRLKERQRFGGEGEMKGRDVYEWLNRYSVSIYMVSSDGARSEEPFQTYTLNPVRHELASKSAFYRFGPKWETLEVRLSPLNDATGIDSTFRYVRDARGYVVEQWSSRPNASDVLSYRFVYKGSDAQGNPTEIASEQAVESFGTVYYRPYGTVRRRLSYW